MERRKQGRAWNGHFLGFWARLNCEEMPVLPAWIVRRNVDDPRKIPYLLVWKRKGDGRIMEALRLSNLVACGKERKRYVDLKRPDGSCTTLELAWHSLPRNRGQSLLLVCPCCEKPRRFVYGWEWDSVSGWSNRVRQISWRCRSCARLRYSSEGGYLRGSGRGALAAIFRLYGNLPRPDSWLPYVFTSIDDSRLDEIMGNQLER